MHETNIERLKKVMNNIHDKKIYSISQNTDENWIKEQKEKEEARKLKFDTFISSINEMYTCKDCNKNCRTFGTRLDDKVILKTGLCFDCLIKMETQLKIDGKYEEYQLTKMQNNAKSWLTDFKQQLNTYKKEYSDQIKTYVSDNGEVEDWGGGMDNDDFNKLMDNVYTEIETVVFGEDSEEKNEKI